MIVISDRGDGTGPAYPVSKQFSGEELVGLSGLLWAINRTIFHPRGFALAVVLDDGFQGFQLWGDGTEPWQFDEATDNQGMGNFETTLERLREAWANHIDGAQN